MACCGLRNQSQPDSLYHCVLAVGTSHVNEHSRCPIPAFRAIVFVFLPVSESPPVGFSVLFPARKRGRCVL
jgi:hypothetical protein